MKAMGTYGEGKFWTLCSILPHQKLEVVEQIVRTDFNDDKWKIKKLQCPRCGEWHRFSVERVS